MSFVHADLRGIANDLAARRSELNARGRGAPAQHGQLVDPRSKRPQMSTPAMQRTLVAVHQAAADVSRAQTKVDDAQQQAANASTPNLEAQADAAVADAHQQLQNATENHLEAANDAVQAGATGAQISNATQQGASGGGAPTPTPTPTPVPTPTPSQSRGGGTPTVVDGKLVCPPGTCLKHVPGSDGGADFCVPCQPPKVVYADMSFGIGKIAFWGLAGYGVYRVIKSLTRKKKGG